MYKILSLDGGGSWSIIQILTLKEKYGNLNGHEILKDFDLVIANSGGSIVLCALAANWSLDQCLEIFDKEETRLKIFHKNSFWKKYFPTGFTNLFGFGPKYSTTKKYQAFNEIFHSIKDIDLKSLPEHIGKPSLRLAVCTFDAINNRAKFFKSYSTSGKAFEEIDSMPLVKAIHGSSNAPVNYFDFPAKVKSSQAGKFYYLWDGALGGFNNPVAAGLIEAIKLGIPKENVAIVSIGTGNRVKSLDDRKRFYELYMSVLRNKKTKPIAGLKFFFANVLNLAKTILYEPPDWSNYVAYITRFETETNQSNNNGLFIRLSPLISPDLIHSDDPAFMQFITKIYQLDMDVIRSKDVQCIKDCFAYWQKGVVPNQPIKSSFNKQHELIHELGHAYFKDGLRDWEELDKRIKSNPIA